MCCWFRKRYLFFFLIFKSDQLKYLFNIIPCKVYHTLQKILIIFAFHQKDKNIRLGLSIDNFEHVNNNFKINAATIEFILYTTGFVKQLLWNCILAPWTSFKFRQYTPFLLRLLLFNFLRIILLV